MKITRDDARYLNVQTAECNFTCWLNAAFMGSWTGDNIEDFKEAVYGELLYVDHRQADEAFEGCQFGKADTQK